MGYEIYNVNTNNFFYSLTESLMDLPRVSSKTLQSLQDKVLNN